MKYQIHRSDIFLPLERKSEINEKIHTFKERGTAAVAAVSWTGPLNPHAARGDASHTAQAHLR